MWVEIEIAIRAAITHLNAFALASSNRRSTRSTSAPIGIAKKSQGSITSALSTEIKTGFLVRVIARSGAATARIPSAKFVVRLAPHSRLNAGPRVFIQQA